MKKPIRAWFAYALVLALSAGCRSQVKAKTQVNASAEDDDRKYELPEEEQPASAVGAPDETPHPRRTRTLAAAQAPTPEVPAAIAASNGPAFTGVTHDLSLASSAPREAVCQCLAVAYGRPTDAVFAWQAGVPAVSPDTMAIAITAEGVPCSVGAQKASISAVGREGNDVVVEVETVGEGRPVMRGALAPAPGPGGALVVRGRKGAPYGSPAGGGAGACRIGAR